MAIYAWFLLNCLPPPPLPPDVLFVIANACTSEIAPLGHSSALVKTIENTTTSISLMQMQRGEGTREREKMVILQLL